MPLHRDTTPRFPLVLHGFYVPNTHQNEPWPCAYWGEDDVADMYSLSRRAVWFTSEWGVKRNLDDRWHLFDSEADARAFAEAK